MPAPTPATTPGALSEGRMMGELVALLNADRAAEAEALAQGYLRVQPRSGPVWKALGVAQLRLQKDALAALGQAAELLPGDAESHANLGSALCQASRWGAGLASLERSLALNPRQPAVLTAAGDALRSLGRAPESIARYQQALRLSAALPEAHNNLGNALLDLGRPAEAIEPYRAALHLRPDDPAVLCNLANALRQARQLEEAGGILHRVLQSAPNMPQAHNCLALLQAARGERSAAEASLKQALHLDPQYIDALNNLGDIRRAGGAIREALALHGRAVELNPMRADSHSSLGRALLDAQQAAEAAACFERALALQPGLAAANLGLATARRMLGQPQEAEGHARAACELQPHAPEGWVSLGNLCADRGRFAEAQRHFQRAREIDPRCAGAFCGIAANRRMSAADEDWRRGAEALSSERLPLEDAAGLRYALGKYYDDVGDYAQAFAHYREANRLQASGRRPFDPQALEGLCGRVVEFCRALGEVPAAASTEAPVFIVGMPRSGTSLLEQMLASHPQIHGAGELRYWDRAFATLEAAAREARPARLAAAAEGYLALQRARSQPRARIIDKMPANFLYAGLIHALFPQARFLHLRRDPRDTCLSMYFQNFPLTNAYANDLGHLAHYYRQYHALAGHWSRELPAAAWLEVPYEDLVAAPESWLRRALGFLGLEWDPRCLQFEATERVVTTASRWQVRQGLNAGSIGRWRHYEAYLGPLMDLPGARG